MSLCDVRQLAADCTGSLVPTRLRRTHLPALP